MSLLQRNISPWRYLPGAFASFQRGDMSRKSRVHRIQFPLNCSPVMNQRIQKIQEEGRMRGLGDTDQENLCSGCDHVMESKVLRQKRDVLTG